MRPNPFIGPNLFLVVAAAEVHVRLLLDCEREAYYSGLAIAETRVFMSPAEGRLQMLRQHFGRDARYALPASSVDALLFYVEHYDGELAAQVKQAAAILATGQQFRADDGGARVEPKPQPVAPAPDGMTFAERVRDLGDPAYTPREVA